jgi:hypothetical protein
MTAFPNRMVGQVLETTEHVEKLIIEIIIPEDDGDERRKASVF